MRSLLFCFVGSESIVWWLSGHQYKLWVAFVSLNNRGELFFFNRLLMVSFCILHGLRLVQHITLLQCQRC